MDEENVEIIKDICEKLEEHFNSVLRNVVEEHDLGIASNVLINVGSSMLAKALLMVQPEVRGTVQYIAYKAVDDKIEEGYAAIYSMMAIDKAKGGGDTCAPWKPEKD
jgi:hypothetical protein